jgi:hypothetical protein
MPDISIADADITLWAAGSTPWLRLLILRLQEGRCSRATPPPAASGYCHEMDVWPDSAKQCKGSSAGPAERGLPNLGGGAALSRPGVEFRFAPGAANYSSGAGPLENKVREIPRLVGAEVQMVGDTGLLAGEANREATAAGGKHGLGIDERRD